MVTLRTPEAPATSKQLWLLHILTKTDTRNLNLTMQQASDRINELKSNGNGNHPQPDIIKTQSTPLFTTVDAEKIVDNRIKPDKWHYCVMYGYAPPNHHWSNGLWRWKACLTTKDKSKALKHYNDCITGKFYGKYEYALVYCLGAHFAMRMLQAGIRTEGKLCKILQSTIETKVATDEAIK